MRLAFIVLLAASPALAKPALSISATSDAASDRVMATRTATFQACFTKERNRDPAIKEHASILVFHISVSDGHTRVPTFDEEKSVKDDNVKSCVALTLVRLKFPKSVELDYTLTYTP
ncbi:MAG TPA: hypothetical protein VGM39_10155 [Kofleriaceae bacterium]|jgi:hypothetical protein